MIIRNEADLIFPYTYDSSNLHGNADLVYIPANFEELKFAIKECYENNVQITVSGSGTGITGSRVPNGGAVISTELLKNAVKIGSDKVLVEPGISLDELDKFLEEYNLFLPPNPTEKNASIGGNCATNASGARTFKYGAIRNYVTKLTVILSNGDILKLERGKVYSNNNNLELITESGNLIKIHLPEYKMPKVKNASGYYNNIGMDAIDIFVGSEGTLGVFGEIELKLLPRPENILGGVIFFNDIQELLNFVINLREKSKINNLIDINENDKISARLIEFFDKKSLELLRDKYQQIPLDAEGAIWFEQEYSKEFEDIIISEWYELIKNYTILADSTWFAMSEKEHENLKEFRHELPLQVYENLTNNSQKKVGLDTAVPDESFPILFNYYLENFPELNLQYVIFGHIGNAHLHANIFCQNEMEYQKAMEFYDKCIDLTLNLNGTVSAEHGIGKLKKKYLLKMYGDNAVKEMKHIKMILDSKYLLGVGTMFD